MEFLNLSSVELLPNAKAIIEPNDYEHVISFYNGSVVVIISQDRPVCFLSLNIFNIY